MGLAMALMLKHSQLRQFPQIETCLIALIAYGSYFFSNALRMSGIPSMIRLIIGIVSLLFCGITLKHYAYHNMSRRTRLGTKYLFQVLAQLSENFIFIYLGLSLFTMTELVFKPTIIVITTVFPFIIKLIIARYLCSPLVCCIPNIISNQLHYSTTSKKSRDTS
jgi:solute carrier family 9 (sodium/hydrogen exchanger), member 6/7